MLCHASFEQCRASCLLCKRHRGFIKVEIQVEVGHIKVYVFFSASTSIQPWSGGPKGELFKTQQEVDACVKARSVGQGQEGRPPVFNTLATTHGPKLSTTMAQNWPPHMAQNWLPLVGQNWTSQVGPKVAPKKMAHLCHQLQNIFHSWNNGTI